MNAQLRPISQPSMSPEARWIRDVDQRAKDIDANTDRVTQLFMAEADWLKARGRGNGHNELIELSVLAMNAWPVIEKSIAGLDLTPDEATALPALFRALKPLINEREVLVRQAAEDDLRAEGKEIDA